MQAPQALLQIWHRFDGIPMETFTKGWWHRQCDGHPRQRTVAEMAEHRRFHGSGGNCFDLALWLRHCLRAAGVAARITGHDLNTPDAHVAVIATDETGREYLCDLGDLWLQPVLVSQAASAFSAEWHAGFFPGRQIRVERTGNVLDLFYRRGTGKVSHQTFDLNPVDEDVFTRACHHSQNLLRRPFCEMLLPHPDTGRTTHWEYDRGRSFWNLDDGPVFEAPCPTDESWVQRIGARTGIEASVVETAFAAYGVSPGTGV